MLVWSSLQHPADVHIVIFQPCRPHSLSYSHTHTIGSVLPAPGGRNPDWRTSRTRLGVNLQRVATLRL